MTLHPALLARPHASLPRVIVATAAVTTAVFAAGLVAGASMMRVGPQGAAAPPQAFAQPPPTAQVQPAVVGAVPAVPHLRWTATASHGAVEPGLAWASTVLDVSSQYSAGSWSAAQVLGAPDVYPQAGDHVAAWATLSADGGREFVEVGFDRPMRLSAVHVVETYNPGAVRRIEAVDEHGHTLAVLFDRGAARRLDLAEVGSAIRVVGGRCTPMAVARIRVSLDSHLVPGWNELDAIGVRACDDSAPD